MSDANPGWLPDPDSKHEWRYWDGARWTDHVADGGERSNDPVRSDDDGDVSMPSDPASEARERSDAREEEDCEDERGPGLYGSNTAANMPRAAASELIGTAILVFTGTAVACGAILGNPTAGQAYDSLAVALAFGLSLGALVAALGHISGAHFNPAVTLGLATTGRFPWSYVPAYLVSQVAGAALGAAGTLVAYGSPARSMAKLAATFPADGVSDLRALAVEAFVAFILVTVIISVATDERVPASAAPGAVGAALAVGVLIAGPVTGGAVNPARALGPMLVAGDLSSFWLYIIGPTVGGVAGAFFYDRFLAQAEAPEADPTSGSSHGS